MVNELRAFAQWRDVMQSMVVEKRGFTFVEMLVVVAIMGVLSTMGIASLRNAIINTRLKEAALDVSAFVERTANEANRVSDTLCMINTTDYQVRVFRSSNCTKNLDQEHFVFEYNIEGPMRFITSACAGLDGSNWLSSKTEPKYLFVPRTGLSSMPLEGYLCMQYGGDLRYGAATKKKSLNVIKPKFKFEKNDSWTDL